ncbi:hypothetical protein [Pseudooceanicola algae]|uniref:Uncharacterized protein n=1 Tax=Pseudooceanicola algae TaxID=1537215 RepID=A0A418SKF8_9RHOB|nr:hypothetical protein [Pseudooceanicola algae]QPM90699.1 hypothetical protein PSAL_019380 [Pseudooceanicola algae]
MDMIFAGIAGCLLLVLVALALVAARSRSEMRREMAQLTLAVEALRKAQQMPAAQTGGDSLSGAVLRKLDDLAETQRRSEVALMTLTAIRERSVMRAEPDETEEDASPAARGNSEAPQLDLPLVDSNAPPTRGDFVRALNFPETADDTEGFAALRKMLKEPGIALLIQAAQDILTLLSQDGIYTDDLTPVTTPAEAWRAYAAGQRGPAVEALAAISAPEAEARIQERLRKDPVFRDTAHHFQRRFDKMLPDFSEEAGEADFAALAQTRTARAFMLLGKAFDSFGTAPQTPRQAQRAVAPA